jgi:hypothetical protein
MLETNHEEHEGGQDATMSLDGGEERIIKVVPYQYQHVEVINYMQLGLL